MLRLVGLALVAAAGVVPVQADEKAPEGLLSAGTQVYLRWDGVDAHRTARENSALGRMLRGETGKFLADLSHQLIRSIAASQTTGLMKKGVQSKVLEKAQADAGRAAGVVDMLAHHGVVLAVEGRLALPPDVQGTIIIPGGGSEPAPLFSTIRLLAVESGVEVGEREIAGRKVQYLDFSKPAAAKPAVKQARQKKPAPVQASSPVNVAWWVEGPHAVLAIGTPTPEALVKRLQEKGAKLPENRLYRRLQEFKEFETGVRAFVDLDSIVKLAGAPGLGIGPILDAWGLRGFKSFVLHVGFEGEFTRSLAELEMPSPRTGIARLFGGKPFSFSDLPPIPPDAQQFMMLNLNLANAFDAATESLSKQPGGSPPPVQEALKALNDALDVNLRADILEALGDQAVIYTSPADGVLFGQVVLIRIKDGAKLEGSLEHGLKSLAIGSSVRVKKKPFRDFQIREVHLKQAAGFPFTPSLAVCKNWLVVALTPQAVQGFILRAIGELPAWQPEPHVQSALSKLPREFTLVSVSDPRPTLKQVLALVPLVFGIANAAQGNKEPSFDIGTLPNAHVAVQYLFPNVMVWTDDGTRVRIDSRGSLDLPAGFVGLDTYGLLFGSFFFRFAF